MLTVGVGLTVTVTGEEVPVHPNAFVALTVNVPEFVTLIEELVALFDHRYVPPPDAVSVTLPPEQKLNGPEAVIVAVGVGLTVTVTVDELAVQPTTFEPVTK